MDLQSLFSAIFNMTITGSIVILCVLAARLVLKKAPRVFSYWLWAAVLFRLLCPVSIESPVSVLNLVEAPATSEPVGVVEYVKSPVSAPAETISVTEASSQEAAPSVAAPAEEPIDWNLIASRVWAVGALALMAYGITSYVNLKRRLRTSAPISRGIREADGIPTPFVLGFLKPTIYLPSDLRPEERSYILLHERFHVRHGDHLVRAAAYLAVCLHWFNPLVWLAFVLSGRDMEMRCDEAVLKSLGPDIRSDYAQSLLNLSTGRKMTLCAPLAFGEGDTGKRVKHVLSWKKKAAWVLIAGAVVCIIVIAVTVLNPDRHLYEQQIVFGNSYRAEAVLGQAVPDDMIYYLPEDDLHLIQSQGDTSDDMGAFQSTDLAAFDLIDEALESELRKNNIHAWRTRESYRWLLWQEDGSLYLTEGKDRVLLLDRIHSVSVRMQTAEDFGSIHRLEALSAKETSWFIEDTGAVLLSGDATLVFTTTADVETLTVREEYYQVQNDGTSSVLSETHVLERTRDYGYELPITRRDYPERQLDFYAEDRAIYTIELGMSRYIFMVNFPPNSGVKEAEDDPQEQTREVTFSENGAYITLQLPESWEYEITSFADDEYSAGISFWPGWYERGRLKLHYYPQGFGVCGTGLQVSEPMTLAGREAVAGTYDNHAVWDYISFGDDFAVWGEEHELWWEEYGDTAMEILNSAQMGLYVDMDAVRNFFRDYRLEDLGVGAVLRGEATYQAVYYRNPEQLRLYDYTAAGTEVEVLSEWSGVVYEDLCVSVNLLEQDGKWIYFGYLRDRQDDEKLENGQFRFLLENGRCYDLILDEFKGFCFVCDAPLEDFRVLDASGTLVLDLPDYLARGGEINQADPK